MIEYTVQHIVYYTTIKYTA